MPVPIHGPGSSSEPHILKGKKLKCPNPDCGKTDELWQNQRVPAMQRIMQDDDGEIEWGSTETLYEYDEAPEDEPQYFCRSCDHYFEWQEEEKEEKSA